MQDTRLDRHEVVARLNDLSDDATNIADELQRISGDVRSMLDRVRALEDADTLSYETGKRDLFTIETDLLHARALFRGLAAYLEARSR